MLLTFCLALAAVCFTLAFRIVNSRLCVLEHRTEIMFKEVNDLQIKMRVLAKHHKLRFAVKPPTPAEVVVEKAGVC